MKRPGFIATALLFATVLQAQEFNPSDNVFRQLGNELATPGVYRNASGAPGPMYWQQRADYRIEVELDDEKQQLRGSEVITYTNNSPDVLDYLWLQLDQNRREKGSLEERSAHSFVPRRTTLYGQNDFASLVDPSNGFRLPDDFDGGFKILEVKDQMGKVLDYTINFTMMRIDLEKPLGSGEQIALHIRWWYNINDQARHFGRSGMEYFPGDDNYIYTLAQFYPRMAAYTDFQGWQNKQFMGRSEFALTFGDFDVKITVPSDHRLGATGVLQNPEEVLSMSERKRLVDAARSFDKPVIIFSEEQARKAMKGKSGQKSTWHFRAENVRDFAFATSRRYIWDAMAVKLGDRTIMAMSLYPPEGNPLWEKYSTRVVAHTLRVYSRMTFDYPYPVAWSANGETAGMEYPMMAFNPGRPLEDGSYPEQTKWDLIGVIIHEVGHNWFPMIVNSDERQWTWMDEGLNTFLESVAEREWDHRFPCWGRPVMVVDYMKGDQSQLAPIMTDGHLMVDFLSNAYMKPAAGLTILRETVMGRELFDFAFRQYALRWKFRHPTPEDFFRTMEDASAVDLDWFWRGWFFGTDPVDIALENVRVFTPEFGDTADNGTLPDTAVRYVQVDFRNLGGMIMPLVVRLNFSDGTEEIIRVPVEIWKQNNLKVSKVFLTERELVSVELDPFLETADINTDNNYWPPRISKDRFELYKSRSR